MSGVRWTEDQYLDWTARKLETKPVSSATGRKASQPNKTESRFESEVLRPWLHSGRIWGYRFRALALIWPEYRYTPDFMAWDKDGLTLIEVKGPYIHSRDSRVRFLTARRDYPWFRFEAWQWSGETWGQIWIDR